MGFFVHLPLVSQPSMQSSRLLPAEVVEPTLMLQCARAGATFPTPQRWTIQRLTRLVLYKRILILLFLLFPSSRWKQTTSKYHQHQHQHQHHHKHVQSETVSK